MNDNETVVETESTAVAPAVTTTSAPETSSAPETPPPSRRSSRRSDVAAAFDKVESVEQEAAKVREKREAASEITQETPADSAPAKPITAKKPAAQPAEKMESTTTTNDEPNFPASWKREHQEAWKTLPPAVRQEITRREREISAAVKDSKMARDGMREFQRIMTPYMQQIQSEGGTPFTAIANVMQSAQMLKTGTPEQRAKAVAAMVRKFGVEIEALDRELAAGLAPEHRTEDVITRAIDSRMAPVNQMVAKMQQFERMRTDAQIGQVEETVTNFGTGRTHFEAVRGVMADLIEMAASRGQKMSLEDAYDRAVWMDPTIRAAAQKEQELAAASTAHAAAEEARRKAASVAGSPAPASSRRTPESIRDALNSAWETHQR